MYQTSIASWHSKKASFKYFNVWEKNPISIYFNLRFRNTKFILKIDSRSYVIGKRIHT